MAKKYIEGFSREKAKYVACDIPYSMYLKLKLKATQDGFSLNRLLVSLIINYISDGDDGNLQDKRNSSIQR
jgi:hypothetical protein